MLPIGTSSSFHISRATSPCSSETPFARSAVRSARGVRPMQPGSASDRPSSANSSQSSPAAARYGSTYLRTRPDSKTSFPAGTGVCVVKIVEARTSSRSSPSRSRSSTRNAEWPSFMWKTVRVETERAQGADAADAEDELLAEPVLAVAAVEPVGDRAGLGRVPLDVGVEQVEARPADVGAPDPGGDGLARELDLDLDRLGLDRQPRRVVRAGSAPAGARSRRAPGGSSPRGRRGRRRRAARRARTPT